MRIALGIEYDGSAFHGWQAQEGLLTIQANLEEALTKIAAEPIKIFCAGRTDAGVHGVGQVVHFDTQVNRELKAWVMGTNTLLPPSIAVRWAQEVDEQFHARFSAISRRYRYVIYNNTVRSALLATRATLHFSSLDITLMQAGANYLLGEHNFSSFRSSRCESKTAMRNVHFIRVTREEDFIIIDIKANAFLHHMVRNISGALMRVGSGLAEPQWVQDILLAENRQLAAETAPAAGLYLWEVEYPGYVFPHSHKLLLV